MSHAGAHGTVQDPCSHPGKGEIPYGMLNAREDSATFAGSIASQPDAVQALVAQRLSSGNLELPTKYVLFVVEVYFEGLSFTLLGNPRDPPLGQIDDKVTEVLDQLTTPSREGEKGARQNLAVARKMVELFPAYASIVRQLPPGPDPFRR